LGLSEKYLFIVSNWTVSPQAGVEPHGKLGRTIEKYLAQALTCVQAKDVRRPRGEPRGADIKFAIDR